MFFPHLCAIYRKLGGEDPLGADSKDFQLVPGLDAVECIYSMQKIVSKADKDAEAVQVEQSFLLFNVGTDVKIADEIRNIRFQNGDTLKFRNYVVDDFVNKPSVITGPHHVKAVIHEIV
jgi:hypothetical protein